MPGGNPGQWETLSHGGIADASGWRFKRISGPGTTSIARWMGSSWKYTAVLSGSSYYVSPYARISPYAGSSANASSTSAQPAAAAARPAAGGHTYLPQLVLAGEDRPATLGLAALSSQTRVISYGYDGLNRLTGASSSTGERYASGYDLAGNRTSVTLNGTTTMRSYNAANQVIGWSYDAAGDLLSDGTTTYT